MTFFFFFLPSFLLLRNARLGVAMTAAGVAARSDVSSPPRSSSSSPEAELCRVHNTPLVQVV